VITLFFVPIPNPKPNSAYGKIDITVDGEINDILMSEQSITT